MGFAIFTFFVVFLLLMSGGLLLFYREEMLKRIADAINPRPKPKSLLSTIQQTGTSIGDVIGHFQNILPRSQAEVSVVRQRLQRAGFRDESADKIFYGTKALAPILIYSLDQQYVYVRVWFRTCWGRDSRSARRDRRRSTSQRLEPGDRYVYKYEVQFTSPPERIVLDGPCRPARRDDREQRDPEWRRLLRTGRRRKLVEC